MWYKAKSTFNVSSAYTITINRKQSRCYNKNGSQAIIMTTNIEIDAKVRKLFPVDRQKGLKSLPCPLDKIYMSQGAQNIIIYNTADGKAAVKLYALDGDIWMNQKQLAELFDTSPQNIGQHISNILNDNELHSNSVIKNYFTTAEDGKDYPVMFYCPMKRFCNY